MKKLDIFILKSYIGPLVLTFFIALFVLLMQFLWKYIDDFVGKGFEISVIAELMFYASATFVPMALPLAVLLSSLMLFGNLGENYELAAIKSAGISIKRVFMPLIVIAIFLSGVAFYFSNNVLPVANFKFRTLLRDVRQQKPAVQIEAGVFYSEIDNLVIRIAEKDPDGITIKDIMIYDHRLGNGNKNVTIAKSGKMEMSADKRFLVFTLDNGFNYDENIKNQQNIKGSTYPMQRTQFAKMVRRIDLSEFDFKKSDNAIHRNNYEMMNISQLLWFRDSLIREEDSTLMDFRTYVNDDFNFLKYHLNAKTDRAQQKPETPKAAVTEASNEEQMAIKETGILRKHNKKTKVIDTLSVVKKPEIIAHFDTNKVFNDTFLFNFAFNDALRIVNTALVMARNTSYHSDIVAQSKLSKEKLVAKHEIELHRKFSLSLACLIFFFVGAPLGAIIRKGGLGTPLVVAIGLFVSYYVFTIIGEKSAKELMMAPALGMWLSTLVFAPLGIFLTYKSTTDAPLLENEFYMKAFERIKKLIPFFNK